MITSKRRARRRARGRRSRQLPAKPGTRTSGSPRPRRITSTSSPPSRHECAALPRPRERHGPCACHFAANLMLFPQSERQSGFFLVLSCCGCWVCRARAGVGGTTPEDYCRAVNMPLDESDLTGRPRTVRRPLAKRASLPTREAATSCRRSKIDNECDLRKNSVNSFYPNYPNCPCVNRFVRAMEETGNSWRG